MFREKYEINYLHHIFKISNVKFCLVDIFKISFTPYFFLKFAWLTVLKKRQFVKKIKKKTISFIKILEVVFKFLKTIFVKN